MIGPTHTDDRPWAVVEALAELADQLRLCIGSVPSASGAAWQGRLHAAGRWWRRAGMESGHVGCTELAAALERAAAAWGSGAAPDSALQARLLQVEAELAELARQFDAGGLDPRRGRAAARPALPQPTAAARAGGEPVILLVASPFLRHVLSSRLTAGGRLVLEAMAPQEVLRLLTVPGSPQLVLCDNEEPTAHLRRLRRLLAGSPGPMPALVLVASGAEAGAGRQRRARTAGADGIWAEPWRAEGLPVVRITGGNA